MYFLSRVSSSCIPEALSIHFASSSSICSFKCLSTLPLVIEAVLSSRECISINNTVSFSVTNMLRKYTLCLISLQDRGWGEVNFGSSLELLIGKGVGQDVILTPFASRSKAGCFFVITEGCLLMDDLKRPEEQ